MNVGSGNSYRQDRSPWMAEDLLNLLNVLGRLVALEPLQADLLDRIVAGPLVLLSPDEQESGTTDDESSQ